MKTEIQIDLIKLADGARLLRFSDAGSALALEKRIEASKPVAAQKEHWLRVFEQLLAREAPAGAA